MVDFDTKDPKKESRPSREHERDKRGQRRGRE
jgi:hypothetical protein